MFFFMYTNLKFKLEYLFILILLFLASNRNSIRSHDQPSSVVELSSGNRMIQVRFKFWPPLFLVLFSGQEWSAVFDYERYNV